MNKLYIIRGLQASGKTTLAKEIVAKNPEKTIRLNRDSIREMFGTTWSKELESIVKYVEYNTMIEALGEGFDVVIDDVSNYSDKTIEMINQYLSRLSHKISIEYIDLFTPLEECIKRDSFRQKPVGEEVIRKTFKRYCSKITTIFNKKELEKKNQKKHDKHAIIVDIDGTLCYNINERPFYGKNCAEKIKDDVPFMDTINLVNNYNGKVIIVTGRESANGVDTETLKWLNKYINKDFDIYMREDNDFSPGVEFKKNIYDNFIKDKYYIDFVLEDSPKIVQMYRNLGLTVLQPTNSMF